MTASIRSLILANLETALAAIDGTGDYNYDVAGNGGVQEWEGGGIKLQKVPTVVLFWARDPSSEQPNGYLTRFLEVIVDIYGSEAMAQTAGISTAKLIEGLVSDVERAVMADPQRGDVAINIDTEHLDSAPFPSLEDAPAPGGSCRFRVRYVHVREDPSKDTV